MSQGFIHGKSRTIVRKNGGADQGPRPRLNFIEGNNVTLTIVDDSSDDEIDITITSTAGGGSPLTTKGDIYTFDSADNRLGVGANDTVLKADSTTGTGLIWEAVAHSETTGRGANDHHTEDHASRHSDGGADEINAVDLGSGAQGSNFILETDGAGGLQWIATPSGGGFTSPLTTKGDLMGYDTDDVRIPVGSDGTYLKADSGDAQGIVWGTISHDSDIADVSIDDHHARDHASSHSDGGVDEIDVVNLGSGAQGSNFILETDGTGGLQWIATPSGSSPLTTKGDLFGFSTVDARLPVGTDNYVLTADSSEALGIKWATAADADAIHDNVANEISALTAKASPVSGDLIIIEDSAASFVKKKVDIANLPAGSTSDSAPYSIAPNDASASIKGIAHESVDGTDDHVQINTALSTYKEVLLLPGTFDIGAPIEIQSGGTLRGSGWTTILKANGITTGNRAVVTNASSTAHGCQLRDLQIHGNYASGGPCHGVNFVLSSTPSGEPDTGPDAASKVSNCLIQKCDGSGTTYSGIRMYSSNSNNRSNWVENCYMRENGAYNVLWDGSSDNFLIGCHFGGCNGVGIRAAGGNSHIWTSKQFFADDNGVEMSSSRTICEGLSVQDNGEDGLNITGADSYAIGVQADTNGRLAAGSGIVLNANGCRVDFISLDRGTTARQDYGIEFVGSPAYCHVTGITKDNQTGHYTGTLGANNLVAIVQNGTTPYKVGYS